MKVFTKSQSAQNAVSVKLLSSSDHKTVLASQDQVSGFLQTILYPKTKSGYSLVIMYDQLDESDDCPLFDFEFAIKSIDALADENLECSKGELPPDKISVNDPFYRLDQEFAFSSEYLKANNYDELGSFYHDIEVKFKHNDYAVDV